MTDVQQMAEELAKAILKVDDIPGKLGHGGMRDFVTEAAASCIEAALRRYAADVCDEAVSEYYDDLNFDNPHFSLTAWLEAKAKELRG